MARDIFSFGEEDTLKYCDKAIDNAKTLLASSVKKVDLNTKNNDLEDTLKDFKMPTNNDFSNNNINNGENVNVFNRQRILVDNSVPSIPRKEEPVVNKTNNSFNNYQNTYSDNNSFTSIYNNNGASFVMIVIAIMLLIFVVSVVTFGLLKIFNV